MQRIIYGSMLLLSQSLCAQNVTISGKLPSTAGKKLELTNLTEQKWTIASDASGSFSTSLPGVARGYYSVREIGPLYLEPGYSLTLSKNGNDIEFKGKGSFENNLIHDTREEAMKLNEDLQNGKYNFVGLRDFITTVETFREAEIKKLNKQKLKAEFIAERKADIDFIIRNLIREYQYNYGIDIEKRKNFYALLEKQGPGRDFSKIDSARKEMEIKKLTAEEKATVDSLITAGADFNNETYFKASQAYRRWMDQAMQTLVYSKYREDFSKGIRTETIKMKIVDSDISNAFIKDYLKYQHTSTALKMSSDLPEADSIYTAYTQQNSNKNYGGLIDNVYNKIKRFSKGAIAPEFEYKTVTGDKVSLASLRGNVVYIDVWATWCGPCKAEIPHLKKIEEEYRDRKIKFVSISVDEQKDAEKWKEFVIEKELKGVQLMADNAFSSSFIQDFNIAAIPRFIIIDAEGRIVSANALRPSNKKLTAELDRLLSTR